MMLKVIGSLIVIMTSACGGIVAAEHIRDQYEQMRYLQKLIYRIRSEIFYSRAYLGEAFQQIAVSSKEPYKSWMKQLAEQTERRTGGLFSIIWEENTRKYLADAGLPKDVLDRLSALGGQFGIADIEMQVRTLDLYLEELNLSMEEQHETMNSRIRLYRCLGVMSGIFVTILLI